MIQKYFPDLPWTSSSLYLGSLQLLLLAFAGNFTLGIFVLKNVALRRVIQMVIHITLGIILLKNVALKCVIKMHILCLMIIMFLQKHVLTNFCHKVTHQERKISQSKFCFYRERPFCPELRFGERIS